MGSLVAGRGSGERDRLAGGTQQKDNPSEMEARPTKLRGEKINCSEVGLTAGPGEIGLGSRLLGPNRAEKLKGTGTGLPRDKFSLKG